MCEVDVPFRSVELSRLQLANIVVAASEIVYFWLKQCPEMAHKRLFCGNVEELATS